MWDLVVQYKHFHIDDLFSDLILIYFHCDFYLRDSMHPYM